MKHYDYYKEVADSCYDYLTCCLFESEENFIKKSNSLILEACDEGVELDNYSERGEIIDYLAEYLYDDCINEDSVTGNGSGSYFYNSYEAEEALSGNLDLLFDYTFSVGCDTDGSLAGRILKKGAETADVCIRIYVLLDALKDAIDMILPENFPNKAL